MCIHSPQCTLHSLTEVTQASTTHHGRRFGGEECPAAVLCVYHPHLTPLLPLGTQIAIDTARGKGAWDDVARLVPKLPSSGHGGDAHDPTSGAIAASTTTTPGTADATPTTTPSTAATTTTTTIAGTGTANAAPSLSSPSNSVDTRGCTRSHPTPATVQAYAATVRGELALKRRGNAAEARRWLWRALEHSPDYPVRRHTTLVPTTAAP